MAEVVVSGTVRSGTTHLAELLRAALAIPVVRVTPADLGDMVAVETVVVLGVRDPADVVANCLANPPTWLLRSGPSVPPRLADRVIDRWRDDVTALLAAVAGVNRHPLVVMHDELVRQPDAVVTRVADLCGSDRRPLEERWGPTTDDPTRTVTYDPWSLAEISPVSEVARSWVRGRTIELLDRLCE